MEILRRKGIDIGECGVVSFGIMATQNGNGDENDGVDVEGLKGLYMNDEMVQKILNHFSGRRKNQYETAVSRLCYLLGTEGEDVTRGQVIEALRKLAALGCGEFKRGRKGYQTRMLWRVETVSLQQMASGAAAKPGKVLNSPVADPERVEAGEGLMNVSYPLRPDLVLEFSLPMSITKKEATRLADFIKTLPFGDED